MVAPRSREGRGRPGRGGRAGQSWARPPPPREVERGWESGSAAPVPPSRVPGPTRRSGMEGVVPHVAALVRGKLLRLDLAERQDRKPGSGGCEWERCGKASSIISSIPARRSRLGVPPRQTDPGCGSRRLRCALAGVTRPVGQALCGRAPGAESRSEPPSAAAAPRVRRDPRPGPAESAWTCGTDGCSLSQNCVDEGAKCLSEACD